MSLDLQSAQLMLYTKTDEERRTIYKFKNKHKSLENHFLRPIFPFLFQDPPCVFEKNEIRHYW